jgi:PAS domain S-box-containing protein
MDANLAARSQTTRQTGNSHNEGVVIMQNNLNHCNVLVVEDDAGVAALEARRLQRAGFEVVSVATPDEALAALAADHVELVVLDYRLPGNMTGLDFFERMKAAGYDLPVILVTGFSNESVIIRALRQGVRDYVTKSVEYLDYLPDAVRRVLSQVRTEHELAESQAQLAGIIGTAMDAVLTVEPDQRITLFNAAAEKMFGCPADSAIGRSIMRFLRGAFTVAVDGTLRIAGQSSLEIDLHAAKAELRGIRPNGDEIPLEASISPVEVGHHRFFTVILRDISERKHTEQALRQSGERLRQIAENMRDVVWMAETSLSKFIYVSPMFEKVWGRSCASLYQNPDVWLDAVHPEDRDAVVADTYKLMQNEVSQHDFRIIRPDGAVRMLRNHGFPIKDDRNRVCRIGGITEDVTEQRLLEEQFRQAQKMEAVGRLASGVAHDFNNLLTVINGYSDIALTELHDGDPLREFIKEIRQSGDRAAGLTRQLLAFSRKQLMVLDILDLNSLIGEMEKMLRRLIGADIDLRVAPGKDLSWVKADAGQIEQVIMNLAVNARDAMPRGGCLTIETANAELDETYASTHPTTRPGKYVMLAVSDTGCGMDQATMARIFEPFFTTKGEKGTGLGLATVYGIVKQTGGHIEVYSEVGVGTTFRIYLPPEKEAAAPSKTTLLEPAKPRGTETILLVEDEQALRTLGRTILQDSGYQVLEAKNGGEAILVAERHTQPINLMITDVVMPKISGRELAERVIPLRPDMKVLFLSGYTDEAIAHHGVLDAGMPFLAKPFSPNALTRKVREVLDHA